MAPTPARPIILYWDTLSGHSHRVRMFLNLLRLPHDIRRVELAKGEHKQPAYLAINPTGQLPAIDDNGRVMFDSNAILTYLALTYDEQRTWFPADPVGASEVVRFLSFAAGPGLSSGGEARLVTVFGAKLDPQRALEPARPSPMSRTTPTPPTRRRAASRSSLIPTSAPGSAGLRRCRISCPCSAPPLGCKRSPKKGTTGDIGWRR